MAMRAGRISKLEKNSGFKNLNNQNNILNLRVDVNIDVSFSSVIIGDRTPHAKLKSKEAAMKKFGLGIFILIVSTILK